MASAKSQIKQANAEKQCRSIYDTALAKLHQQRGIALVGTVTKLLAGNQLVTAMRVTVACGALQRVPRAEAVVDGTRAAPVRDLVIDMCAGRQSMKGPARRQGYRYVAVEIEAVIMAVGGGAEGGHGVGSAVGDNSRAGGRGCKASGVQVAEIC